MTPKKFVYPLLGFLLVVLSVTSCKHLTQEPISAQDFKMVAEDLGFEIIYEEAEETKEARGVVDYIVAENQTDGYPFHVQFFVLSDAIAAESTYHSILKVMKEDFEPTGLNKGDIGNLEDYHMTKGNLARRIIRIENTVVLSVTERKEQDELVKELFKAMDYKTSGEVAKNIYFGF